ncbi:TetR/AcrR family transcriptional regulator [Spiractinospora alimapuensis]|uniref:TetR/AcrR family transcriptional regulator n=1 Tax=Spiractinospora alimapuensis TaxID=2820884 RepID=UPI001F31E35C|nr:TetR/AcrR family transcriptional regulator [Spiractinospora alimapuensis]QVQ51481.1 TetR/AcrR family transcriptional regulator [Spiractinospora alimapuensis]
MPERQRADARRNYARILTVAEAEVAAHGAEASLEKIARVAGVGSATVRRHFPTRRALMYAVFQQRIDGLCSSARLLAAEEESRQALLTFLSQVLSYCIDARGFAATLAHDDAVSGPVYANGCARELAEATDPLLNRAVADGSVREGVTAEDLIATVVGIALATENHPDPATQANRLFSLAIEGISPPP